MSDKVMTDPSHGLHYSCSVLCTLYGPLYEVHKRLQGGPHADLGHDALLLARQVSALYVRAHEAAGWGRPTVADLPDQQPATSAQEAPQ